MRAERKRKKENRKMASVNPVGFSQFNLEALLLHIKELIMNHVIHDQWLMKTLFIPPPCKNVEPLYPYRNLLP